MSRTANRAGKTAGRVEKNRLFQAALRARKRLRRQRRSTHVVIPHRVTSVGGPPVANNIVMVDDDEGVIIANDTPQYPTEEQWAEVCAEAKSKKKGIEKMARSKGWQLIYDGGDPKNRLDWTTEEND